MRLISKCVMEQTKNQATAACGNVQLCGGTKCGIEANLHALRAIWPQCAGWLYDEEDSFDPEGEEEGAERGSTGDDRSTGSSATAVAGNLAVPGTQESRFSAMSDEGIEAGSQDSRFSTLPPPEEGSTEPARGNAASDGPAPDASPALMPNMGHLDDPTVDRGADPNHSRSRYQAGVGFGMNALDADNAFNRLTRYLMLWQTAMLWSKASRFVFNRYWHWNLIFLRDEPGKPAIVIHSKEGTMQGDVFGAQLFAVGMMPLCSKLREEIPEAVQPWFADDGGSGGEARHNAAFCDYVRVHGPTYGYYIQVSKGLYVCKQEDERVAKAEYTARGLDVKFVRGHAYLGGFVGSHRLKKEWLEQKVEVWTKAVETLGEVARRYPQAVHAAVTISLQNEWQYVQRVVPDSAPFFSPLERAIRNNLLPPLLGVDRGDIDAEFRELLGQSVKGGGIGIRNPVDTAQFLFEMSNRAAEHLIDSLVDERINEVFGRPVGRFGQERGRVNGVADSDAATLHTLPQELTKLGINVAPIDAE